MLGKHENRFPILASSKIAIFLYHGLTKRLLHLDFCSLVDPVLTQKPGYSWQLEFRRKSWMLALYTCITCVCSANKQTWRTAESDFRNAIYWSQASQPARAAAKQAAEGTNQHQPHWHLLKDSIYPGRQKFVTQEVLGSLVSGVTPTVGTCLLL